MTTALEQSTDLRSFLSSVRRLTVDEKLLIARQAMVLLESNYAHLPLKNARYALNPVQRLRLVVSRLSRAGVADEPDWRFHAEIKDIFDSLRDLHTRYVMPEPYASAVAFLPFRVKEFFDEGRRAFMAIPAGEGSTIPAHVELLTWNGVPMDRAVDLFADRQPGANPAARTARALTRFTTRQLGFSGPPDEEFVLVEYLDAAGARREARERWRVALPQQDSEVRDARVESGPDLELDIETARLAWLRTRLFAPNVLAVIEEGDGQAPVAVSDGIPVTRAFARAFEARAVPGTEIGHIRIREFTPPGNDVAGFVNEFIRLLGQMPAGGVVVDIRGNGGGNPVAAELVLQSLTASRIESQPLQFIVSPLNLRICRGPGPGGEDLGPWRASMEQAVESGAVYSAGVPRTTHAELCQVPHAYIGPVLLLTDALVYSAADRFAAGFQDNRVGDILGVDANTGAGGANVWQHGHLFGTLAADADSPYRRLPGGTGLSVAIRRTLRVGRNVGVPVEDFGVEPERVHRTTRADLVGDNVDLFAFAAGLLREHGRPRRFGIGLKESADGVAIEFEAAHVDRADVHADGRPRHTVDLGEHTRTLVTGVADATELRVEGYEQGRLVALRIFRRDGQGQFAPVVTYVPA
ncbi:S41 family peptidase [Asanoa siamensis]|uniref:Tail specific protease domain-containing protein n=1 Tax=Asanoa siamensis TaxID=926357 RepID=A0ABQ4CRC4_9ACTN|nr:S41 family peptidase [Asanoa siamensis]GIF73387.1 hypothetical protein Asi02nite_29050 [Asanoa siamensis]